MSPIQYVPTPFSYSAAVQAGDFVFIGLHRGFGETFSEQFEGALTGVKSTLESLGIGLDQLVQIRVWLKDVRDLPEMEKLVLPFFAVDRYPARMTATTEFIDEDCLVMLEGTAYRGD